MYTVAARQVWSATGRGSSAIIPSNRPKVIGSTPYEGTTCRIRPAPGLDHGAPVGVCRKWMDTGPGLEAITPAKGRGWQGSALRQYDCAIGERRRLVRGADFRTASRPGHESNPACEAARRVGAASRPRKCPDVKKP